MTAHPECDQYPGRLRELCSGEADPSRPVTLDLVNRWRASHGLATLDGLPPAPPPDFACVHRGALVRVGSCDLCGSKGQTFDVLGCAVHGECSINRRHSKVKACAACPDRVAR